MLSLPYTLKVCSTHPPLKLSLFIAFILSTLIYSVLASYFIDFPRCLCCFVFSRSHFFPKHGSALAISRVPYQCLIMPWPPLVPLTPLLPFHHTPLSFTLFSNESNRFEVTPRCVFVCACVQTLPFSALSKAHTDVSQTRYVWRPFAINQGG